MANRWLMNGNDYCSKCDYEYAFRLYRKHMLFMVFCPRCQTTTKEIGFLRPERGAPNRRYWEERSHSEPYKYRDKRNKKSLHFTHQAYTYDGITEYEVWNATDEEYYLDE